MTLRADQLVDSAPKPSSRQVTSAMKNPEKTLAKSDRAMTDQVIRIFIGYDPREAVAFSVLAHSIHMRASKPVSITPLILSQLRGVFTRKRDPLQSTDFSFTRFLTPFLSGYEGWSLFMDCDMIVLQDVAELWRLCDDRYAVMCVKHHHVPK